MIAAGLGSRGTVTYGEAWPVAGISPITTLAMKGSTVEAVLEQQWIPPAYGCSRLSALATSANFRYTYDLGRPVGDRVDPAKVLINGKPLQLDRTYRVTTSAAMPLHGAQYGYPGFQQYSALDRAPRMGQEVFLNYLRTHPLLKAPSLGRVTAIPGTPPPADGPFGPLNLLPQNEMTATATSQGSAAYSASAAIDGKLHHHVALELESACPAPAVHHPRPEDTPCDRGARLHAAPGRRRTERPHLVVRRPDEHRRHHVHVGDEGIWDGTVDAKIARFPAGTTARYVRLVGLAGGADYAAATELNIALAPGS